MNRTRNGWVAVGILLLGLGLPLSAQETAAELFNQAAALISNDKPESALGPLRRAAAMAPRDPVVHRYLGYALWRLGQWDAAANELNTAMKLAPGDMYAAYFLGRVDEDRGKTNQAILLFQIAASGPELVYDSVARLGQAYFKRGQFQMSEDAYRQAVRAAPLDSSLHYQLARVLQKNRRLQDADEEFKLSKRLADLDQQQIRDLFVLSNLVREKKDADIESAVTKLMQESTDDAEIMARLGLILAQGGYQQQALAPLERASLLKPSDFETQFNLGLCLSQLGQAADAETALLRADNLRPNSFEVNSALAVLYVNQSRTADAIQRLRRAQALQPDDPAVLALLGHEELAAGRYRDAVKVLVLGSQKRPDDPRILALLCDGYHEEGHYSEALSTARRLMREHPDEAIGYFKAGREMLKVGRNAEANQLFEDATRLDASFEPMIKELQKGSLRQTGAPTSGVLQ